MSDRGAFGPGRVVAAWAAHLYTAVGLVLAAGMAVVIVRGDRLTDAFWLMLAACLVDATDGTLARRAGVKDVLPGFVGRRLDDITDFLTYTFLPLLLVWRAGLVSPEWALLLPLLASAYGFCQVEAKTPDGYFLGFPSYWNVVAFYLYALRPPAWLGAAVVAAFAVLTFVPARYLYPTQRGRLNFASNVLAVPWVVMLVWALLDAPAVVVWLSLYYPAFYLGASWAVSVRRGDRRDAGPTD